MARTASVVSRPSPGEVALAALGALLLLCALVRGETPHRYSASAADIDLAVVSGIRTADAHSITLEKVRAVVVPHHLVASEAIALGVRALVPLSPSRVIILSPDHFDRCPTFLCTDRALYETFFGEVFPDTRGVRHLLAERHIVSVSDLFTEEHGISAVMPFVKHYLPDAKIIPVVVSQRGRGDEVSRREALEALQVLMSQGDTALIVSTDFSHYLPRAEAEERDRDTLSAFCTEPADALIELDNPDASDCPLCLWFARRLAEGGGYWNPRLLWHSNSADLLPPPAAEETTSHFVFALSAEGDGKSCFSLQESKESVAK